ncbi:hypothetical protein, partial [Bordetella pertussis]|uniref:hypothetical protein n=1 Tax=Bordetella pertussis TaxID=520 RepID=UPI0021B83202
ASKGLVRARCTRPGRPCTMSSRGASGNVNTEEIVHMFACMGVATGVALAPLL